jgi:hypothetical protein
MKKIRSKKSKKLPAPVTETIRNLDTSQILQIVGAEGQDTHTPEMCTCSKAQ